MPFSRRKSSMKFFSAPYLFTFFLLELASAASSTNASSPSSIAAENGDTGGSLSSFKLKPVDATIFSLSIIFGFISALQLLAAAFNIPKHFSNSSLPLCLKKGAPTPFTLPTPINTNPIPLYALGPIFPIALTMATLCLLVTYILRAAFWGGFFNQAANTGYSLGFNPESIMVAWVIFCYLRDAFLSMSLFSFVCFRIRRLCYCTCRGKLHIIKRIFDMVLVFTLFMLGTAYVGYRAHLDDKVKGLSGDMNILSDWDSVTVDHGDWMRLVQLKRVNDVLLVVVAVEVFVSAIMLHNHAGKYQSAPDRKVAMLIGTVIAPLFLTYALYNLVSQEVLIIERDHQTPSGFPAGVICQVMYSDLSGGLGFCSSLNSAGLAVGRVIVTCITLSVIIWMFLRFSGASLVDALKGRSSTNGAPREQCGGQVYVHTHGLTYKL